MRTLDLLVRLAFFAIVPFLATRVSAAFPMTGVLVNIALALAVFVFAEAVRRRAERSRILRFVARRQLAFEEHYRAHPPGPFVYYLLSPILFPYWLLQREARREVLLYNDLTIGGSTILLVGGLVDFFRNWQPQLGVARFLQVWALLFAVQAACTLVFVVPVATTIVKLHNERRFRALWLLLAVGVVSAGVAIHDLGRKRAPVVSWVTTERTRLRTDAQPAAARAAQMAALEAVRTHPEELSRSTDKRGWVEDDSLDRAEEALAAFYKDDETYAFSLHASPPEAPKVLVLQCHLGPGRASIWRAIRMDGQEVRSQGDLPEGIVGLPRKASRRPPTRTAPYRRAGP